MLATNSRVPTTSGTDNAIWRTTNPPSTTVDSRRRSVRPGASVRAFVRVSAGARPRTKAAVQHVTTVTVSSRASALAAVPAIAGRNRPRTRPPMVRTTPRAAAPASMASRRACSTSSRTSRHRVAPSAAFIASSAPRRSPESISRLPTLPQAISRTSTPTPVAATSTMPFGVRRGAWAGGRSPSTIR